MRTLMREWDNLKTLSIVGMCKNAGKTTVLNRLLSLKANGEVWGLTSIGRDGESTDVVTGTEKPGIFVPQGTLIATAKDMLRLCFMRFLRKKAISRRKIWLHFVNPILICRDIRICIQHRALRCLQALLAREFLLPVEWRLQQSWTEKITAFIPCLAMENCRKARFGKRPCLLRQRGWII